MKSIACKALLSAGCLALCAAASAQEAPVVVQEEGGPEYVAAAPPPPPQQADDPRDVYRQPVPFGVAVRRAGEEEAGGWIGIAVSKAPPAMAYQLRLRPGVGVVVDNIVPKSPAQRSGLQPYDLIEKLDDQLLVNPEQFTTLVRGHKPGETVTLSIIREGEKQTLAVKLSQVRDQPMFQPFTQPGQPMFQPFAPGGQRPPMLPQSQWQRPPAMLGAPPKLYAPPYPAPAPPQELPMPPGSLQKMPMPPAGRELRIEREEPGRIVILRDGDGREILIVRDPNGKVIVKQPMNDGGPKAKALPESPEQLDRLKLKLRKQADDERDPTFRRYPQKQDPSDDDGDDAAQPEE